VPTNDINAQVVWTRLLLQAQGYTVKQNITLQDNLSSMKLETDGSTSSEE
jgi:hypothetical protein